MIQPVLPLPDVVKHHPHRLIGGRLLRYHTLPSTMDEARRLAREGIPEGSVVVTANQTQGRGRFGRSWISSPGACVTLSVVLYPEAQVLPILGIVATVGVVRAVHRLTGLMCAIKWPNDVRISGRKVCGILVESEVFPEGKATAIVGIGLNVNMDPAAHPEVAETATSLARELGTELSMEKAEDVLLEEMEAVYAAARRGGEVLQEWRDALETLGQQVEVRWGESVERGLARHVDGWGYLILERKDGSTVTLAAGEVTLLGEPQS